MHTKFEQNRSINTKVTFKGHCGLCLAFDCKGHGSHFDPEGPDQLWGGSSNRFLTNNNEFQQKSKPTEDDYEDDERTVVQGQPGDW